MAKTYIGVQMYTLRDKTDKDMVGTLKQLAKLGYQAIELAGFGSASPQQVAEVVKQTHLKVCGAHVGIEQLEKDLPGVLDTYGALGCTNIVVPYLAEDRRKDAKGYKAVAKQLNKLGAVLRKRGFALGYHNHAFEFNRFDGKTGMDILIEQTDAENVSFELDTFWVQYGGMYAPLFIKQHAKRIMSLHIKDMNNPDQRKFANVGAGMLDITQIIKAGRKAQVAWFIVEQDDCYGQDTLDAVKISLKNIGKLGIM